MPNFPDFLIVGAQKSGTTSLWKWLRDHPGCFLPQVKEPHFFARFEPWEKLLRKGWFVRDVDEYKNLFTAAYPDQKCGEASPSYLYENGVAQRIKDVIPACKIIISLRDPVHRAYSEYMMNVLGGLEVRSFSDAIWDAAYGRQRKSWDDIPLYIELSKYGTQAERYYNVFPKEQILVLTTTQINRQPRKTMRKISAFLGLSTDFWDNYHYPMENRGSKPRNTLTKSLLTSTMARRLGRMLVHPKIRPYVSRNILGRPTIHKHIETKEQEIIWSICESEIRLLETLVGQHFPELWETFTRNSIF